MFETAVGEDGDLAVYGAGAGASYEGGATAGIGAGGSGSDDKEAVEVVDPRMSYNFAGGTAYDDCIDE
jgi:hypothetical protein